jgi:hypothetical protein
MSRPLTVLNEAKGYSVVYIPTEYGNVSSVSQFSCYNISPTGQKLGDTSRDFGRPLWCVTSRK